MKNLNKIIEERPELSSNTDFTELAEQAEIVHNLKVLHDTDGGKQLVSLLLKDAVGCVHRLRSGYASLSHIELIALCAQMDVNISTAKLLIDADEVKKVLDEEIEEALRE